MESLPEEEQELSAVLCNPDMGLVMTQLLIFCKLKHLPGIQGSLGYTSEGGPLAQIPEELPLAVSSPRLPSPGNASSEQCGLVATTPLTTTPLEYQLCLWFLLCPWLLLPS